MDDEDQAYISSVSWWTWWWWWPRTTQPSSPSNAVLNNESEIAAKQNQVRRVIWIVIFTAKLVSSLLASTICYAIFAHAQDSPLDMELSHRWLFFLAIFTLTCSTISCFSSTILIFASLAINTNHNETPSVAFHLQDRKAERESQLRSRLSPQEEDGPSQVPQLTD